jgi:hypothetical protein
MVFSLYFVGFLVLIAGLASLAIALGISEAAVTGAALAILALGLFAGILRHRARGRSAPV